MHEGRPRSKESDHGIFIFAAGYGRRGMFSGFGGFGAAGIAAPMSFKVDLNGARQMPPVETGATGTADLTYDPATRVLTWDGTRSSLSGPDHGEFPRAGNAGQKCPAGDLAERKGRRR